MSEVRTMVTVRLKPRMTILPKRKRTAVAELLASWGNSFRDRVAQAHRGRPATQHYQIERLQSVRHFTTYPASHGQSDDGAVDAREVDFPQPLQRDLPRPRRKVEPERHCRD